MKKRRNYEDLGDMELPPEVATKVNRMIADADEEDHAARVNFRWGKEQVDVIKQAAGLMGVPYQTYIKQVVYRQALTDLNAAATIRQEPA